MSTQTPRHTHHSYSRSRSRSPDRDRPDSRHHRHHHRDERDERHRRHRHERRHREERHREKGREGERDHHRRRHHHHDATQTKAPTHQPQPVILPYQARELSRRDLSTYEPMFAMYLDIQKGLFIEELSEEEVKGRWKSFMSKWNRGELAEGWYDPSTLAKARQSAPDTQAAARGGRGPAPEPRMRQDDADEDEDEDDEEEYGPTLPFHRNRGNPSSGPTIPTTQDLQIRRETAIDDALEAREDSRKQRRADVHSHKSELRHMEDEVAPRAEPGTHERKMEKRREAAASNKAFAESRRGGSPTDAAPEEDLMGSGENELDAIRKEREKDQRKKNEREIRREEIQRARAAEREERLQQYRQKEEETIGWLKTLAKQRFG